MHILIFHMSRDMDFDKAGMLTDIIQAMMNKCRKNIIDT
jgi:hypothetical protein